MNPAKLLNKTSLDILTLLTITMMDHALRQNIHPIRKRNGHMTRSSLKFNIPANALAKINSSIIVGIQAGWTRSLHIISWTKQRDKGTNRTET